MRKYTMTGDWIHPDYLREDTFKKYLIYLVDNILIEIYCRFSLVQVIDVLTEKDYVIIYNEFGHKEMISRNHIVKITEVK